MEKAKKNAPKKEKKIGGGSCPPGKCFFWGGGKCPNLGVVNVRILGVVNVLLANDSQSILSVLCNCESAFFDALFRICSLLYKDFFQ